jgi:uncharacterized protein YndB with AHSA1/START domain
MSDNASQPVSVSRTIAAPASAIFAVLARPARHPDIDGSGMLLESSDDVIGGTGDIFTMKMHNDEMGDYAIANHVVEYEPGRRIGWEPVLAAASRPEDQGDIGVRSEVRWSFELTPLGPDATLVCETYDCSRAPAWLQKAVDGGSHWIGSMTATLEKLDALARG